jgi:hypothetical protein
MKESRINCKQTNYRIMFRPTKGQETVSIIGHFRVAVTAKCSSKVKGRSASKTSTLTLYLLSPNCGGGGIYKDMRF